MSNIPQPDIARENVRKKEEGNVTGTRKLPIPEDGSMVAGMPRANRIHTEPGDPGNIAPENQVANTASTGRTSTQK